jgi:hypothetical protein
MTRVLRVSDIRTLQCAVVQGGQRETIAAAKFYRCWHDRVSCLDMLRSLWLLLES